jgi:hypothetical protein
MDQINGEAGRHQASAEEVGQSPRFHRPYFAPQFEAEIGQLYLQTMDEPVPPRLLTILRTGLSGSKA